jgi:hypothetical protein
MLANNFYCSRFGKLLANITDVGLLEDLHQRNSENFSLLCLYLSGTSTYPMYVIICDMYVWSSKKSTKCAAIFASRKAIFEIGS